MKKSLRKEFKKIFNKEASKIYFSPGRVNLIGEHIDYNGGLVMPCAITFGTYLLVSRNDDNLLRFRSLNFEEKADVPLQADYKKNGESWFNYPLGIIEYFLKGGHPPAGGM